MANENTRYLTVTPDRVATSIIPSTGEVLMHLDLDQEATGLLGVAVAIRLSTEEARKLGSTLSRRADEAEAIALRS